MDRTKKAWINFWFLLVTLAVNALGAFGLINGLSQKAISDMYVTLITPSPATFRIWSMIYSLLLISVVMAIVRKTDPYYQKALDQTTLLFRLSCLLNIAWIIAFSYVQLELSTIFIFGFVITLALICMKLTKIQEGKRWLLPLSFGIYTGWLFIATVVNVSAALVKAQWSGLGIPNYIWAIIMLVISILLLTLVLSQIRNAAFPVPVAWAYFGIYQFLSSPQGFKGDYGLLQIVALVGSAVLIGIAAFQLYRNGFSLLPQSKH